MTPEEELKFLEALNETQSLRIDDWNPKIMSDYTLETIISRATHINGDHPVITEELYERLVYEHLGEHWGKKYLEIYPYSNPKPSVFIYR